MTVREVAAYLRLSEMTVYRLAQEGAIPAAKIGRTWRFRRDLIDEWFRGTADTPDAGTKASPASSAEPYT
ncbi:MAG: helix-turn-helix domain-containing protein [Anaerolineae bacterium]|nr:helix-turn-helix domain-containing protein [Anaerolineae bacterium]